MLTDACDSLCLESLNRAKTLRENADYYDQWSKEAAESGLSSAQEFLSQTGKLIETKK